MGSATEPSAKPHRLSQFLRGGGKWLCLAAVSLLGAIFLGDKEDWPIAATLAVFGLLLCLVGSLLEENRGLEAENNVLREEKNALLDHIEILKAPPWEPDNDVKTVLCFFVDAYPQSFEPHEVQECLEKMLSKAKIEWALEALVKNRYLKFDDGRGPVPGADPYPESYVAETKGRIYVEDWRRERGL